MGPARHPEARPAPPPMTLRQLLAKLRLAKKEPDEETYTSTFGKQRPKPQDKMRRQHEDK